MNAFLHLLRFELLRLRWPLLWIAGLMATELGIRAWLVFGPVGKDWPNPPVPLAWLTSLLGLSLVFVTASLFLGHTITGSRSPVLTQAIPRLLFPAVKLPLLAFLVGITWTMGCIVRWIHGSASGWEAVPEWVITVLPIVAWLAVQAETPGGMAKAMALWAFGIWIYLAIVSIWADETPDSPSPDVRALILVLYALAAPVIALNYLTRRRWPKVLASTVGILILFDAFYWEFQRPDRAEVPVSPAPAVTAGKATISQWDAKGAKLQLEPSLLERGEYPVLSELILRKSGGEPSHRIQTPPFRLQNRIEYLRRLSLQHGEDKERCSVIELAGLFGGREKPLGGEAVIGIFRLEPSPFHLKPGQSHAVSRINGRNAVIRRNGGLLWWARTGFAGASPAVVRATQPGQVPMFEEYVGNGVERDGFRRHQVGNYAPPDSAVEVYEEHFVRTIRVTLVPETPSTP